MIIAITRYEDTQENWKQCNNKYSEIIKFAIENSEYFGVCTFKNIHKKDQKETFFYFMKMVDEYKVSKDEFELPVYRGGQVFHICSLNNSTKKAILNVNSFENWYIYDYPEDLCFFHNHKVWFRCHSDDRIIYIKVIDDQILKLLKQLNIEYEDVSWCMSDKHSI